MTPDHFRRGAAAGGDRTVGYSKATLDLCRRADRKSGQKDRGGYSAPPERLRGEVRSDPDHGDARSGNCQESRPDHPA